MTLGLCSGRQKAGHTSAPRAGSARKFEAPRTRTSPCGEGLRCAGIPTVEADELGAIVRIAPQEFLREVRKIETVKAPLPFGSASHGAPPFDGLATATAWHPAFSYRGSRLPRTGDARRFQSGRRRKTRQRKPPIRRRCALHDRSRLGTIGWRAPNCWQRTRGQFRQTSCTPVRLRPGGRSGQGTSLRPERRQRPGLRIRLILTSRRVRSPAPAEHDRFRGRIPAPRYTISFLALVAANHPGIASARPPARSALPE